MFTELTKLGLIIRVRLTPNSSSCSLKGIFKDADGQAYLKINVISVPEKGKANRELISFLSKKLKTAKSNLQLVSGETDRYKKILISENSERTVDILRNWLKEEGIDEGSTNY